MDSSNQTAQQPLNQDNQQPGSLPSLPPLADDQGAQAQPQPIQITDNSLPAVGPSQAPQPDPLAVQVPAATAANPKLSQHSPAIADDVDLIEKEWVIKAKDIVQKTRDNPNAQSEELSKFKADYLKTRYGKDLKVSEN